MECPKCNATADEITSMDDEDARYSCPSCGHEFTAATGTVNIGGKSYKCVFDAFTISEPPKQTDAFADDASFADMETVTVTFSSMLGGSDDEPSDYRDRLHNPPQN